MSRDSYLNSINAKNNEEIIDGVRIVYSGFTDEYGNEMFRAYDSSGNSFYSNFSSLEEAEKEVQRLKESGKDAVVGPKGPWLGKDGATKNRNKNAVGVYIVIKKKKKENEEKEPSK